MKTKHYFIALFTLISLIGFSDSFSCTVFRLTAKDGSIMTARSMEFAYDLHYDMIVVPRNKSYASPFKPGIDGIKWTTRFGYVAVASLGMDYGTSEGMNEIGLGISLLWYETDMKWQDVTLADSSKALAQSVFNDWVLGSFASVEEVRKAVTNVKVFNYVDPVSGMAPTCHFIVYDASGGCIVIEYDNGICNIYDNPLGIMTNAPSFPWQINNLRQYIGVSPENPRNVTEDGITLKPTGHGSGMFGIPGDYTPPSRFVRLGILTRFVDQQADAASNLILCDHVINTFAIPQGIITDTSPDGKKVIKETTQWVTFRDLTNRVLYFKTYGNSTLRKIDLKEIDFNKTTITRIPMFGTSQMIIDIMGKK